MAEKKKRLPQGWATIELGKLIARTQSVNPSITTENVYELWSVPAFPSDTPEYIQGKEIGSNKQVVKPGDVLLCKINPRINRVWLVREKIKADQIASTEWIVLRFKELFPRFIMYQLREEEFRNRLCSDLSGVGGSLTRARPRIVGKLEINIAPLNEQKRIVSKIEDLQSHSRRAKEALETIPDLLEQLRQSVLAAGVRGDLTKSWREKHAKNIEPASKLLERILTERRKIWEEAELAKMKAKGKSPKDDKWKKRYKDAELPKIEETYKIPETWVWTNIGQLSWSVKDGPHYSPKYSETGIPFISGGNVRPEGIDFSTAKYISPELHAQLSERCKPEFGDLLYTKGGTTGIARINTEKREFNVWVHVAVLKLVDSINPFYLQNALNSLYCYRQSQKYTHGVGNQDLGLTRMIWITVPLPPLQEQTEIIRRADEISSIVSKIQKLTDLNLNHAESLRQSILKSAFTGDLVPQDPNDEPASILLERICKEKARQAEEQKAKPRQRGKKMKQPKVTQQDILTILKETTRSITPEELFAAGGFDENSVDAFYDQLRAAVSAKQIREKRKGSKVHLEAIK